jgi:dTDP-4-amino-4,6-dideoxygalactose transaminase
MITVTRPSLPNLSELMPMLENIWHSGIITNNGSYCKEFEQRLSEYLDTPFVSVVSNATNGLLLALKALNISGDVVTSPYSFAATENVLRWLNLNPIMVDTDELGNIDPDKIEQAITKNTTAILPIHVYGRPCDTEKIQNIADKYNLKVIYDAAHAFGIKVDFGDISVISMHATKVFNTCEGGIIISKTAEIKKKIDLLRNFGIENEDTVSEYGINAKLDEIRAAIGILNLKTIDSDIMNRKVIFEKYRTGLKNVPGIRTLDNSYNGSYFPIFIDEKLYGHNRDYLYEIFKSKGILTRKYFYPIRYKLEISSRLSNTVLCLPIYPGLEDIMIEKIINLIISQSQTYC